MTQMMTNDAAGSFVLHTETLHVEAAQEALSAGSLCRPSHTIAGSGVAVQVGDSSCGDAG